MTEFEDTGEGVNESINKFDIKR